MFLRIHRSFIVKLNFVVETRRDGPKRGNVLVKDGTALEQIRTKQYQDPMRLKCLGY